MAVGLVCAHATPSIAAEPAADPSGRGPNQIGLWGGGSVASSTLIGKSSDFGFGLAGFQYGRRLTKVGTIGFDWTVDAIPLAFLSLDLDEGQQVANPHRDTIYGAGLAPLGFRLDWEATPWLEPYIAATGGFLYFTERVPSRGVKFNFTYDFGLGALIAVGPAEAITLGYKYHHISNAGIGDTNPGFDSNVLYAGFSIFR